ncbi:MAG: TRAP transporter large permease subunit, partial [Pseudomonadota bacterium]|nr:TRAP transporter large permease subunit [Pseudomonadota bacterium]
MGPDIIIYALLTLLVLTLLGVHIGIALGISSMVGVYGVTGNIDVALSVISSTSYEAIRNHSLAIIPLFVLMGEIINRSGAASDLYKACDRALRRIPGRLAVATVAGNTVFAAVSGVSIASAATFSRIAYPEMQKAGYNKSFALGVISGSACLGMLIPPSVLLIVWAILSEGSVGALFLGGVGPGLVLGLTFAVYCLVSATFRPSIAPPMADNDIALTRSVIIGSVGIILLVLIVIGGIWGGIFTPTEAAGFGALGSALIAHLRGMRGNAFLEAIYDAGRTTAPIMFMLITGSMYARFMAMSGGTSLIQDMFLSSGMTVFTIIAIMTLVWLFLGAFVDSISVILMTLPIFYPIAMAAGINEIAFAIYGILVIEAGL